MKSIFAFDNYKDFVKARIKALPKQGHGELARIAKELRMHPTRVSHIFNADMNLTSEQACELSKYFGLSDLESDYFLALVQLERAGSTELKRTTKRQLEKIKTDAKELVNRVPRERALSDEEKALFYSSWAYSAIRLMTSIEGRQDIASLAAALNLAPAKVRKIIDFLLQTGLCLEEKGRLKMGPKSTHLESTSDIVLRHHANWRIQALQRHETLTEAELAYTGPVTVTAEDFKKIREDIAEYISRFTKQVVASEPPEQLACLNIDWFKVER